MKYIFYLFLGFPLFTFAQIKVKSSSSCVSPHRADLSGTCVKYYITTFADSNYVANGDSIIFKVTTTTNEVYLKKLLFHINPETGSGKFIPVFSETKDCNVVFLNKKNGDFEVSCFSPIPQNYCSLNLIFISKSLNQVFSAPSIQLKGCQ